MARKKKLTEKPMVLATQEIVAKKDTNIYDGRQMIPADNVDADGKAWPTLGENIRHGVNGAFDRAKAIEMLSALLGHTVEVEEVTCVLKPGATITVDNPKFIGHSELIEAKTKTIAGFL